jgi:hypothetical protein
MSSTENLLHLLQQYENTSNQKEVTVEQPKEPEVTKHNKPQNTMELEYCPQKVHYFKYKNYSYRREIDLNNNIRWEVVHGDLRHTIENQFQIDVLERRVEHIVN